MSRLTLADRMERNVYDLSVCKPRVDGDARLSRIEFAAYWKGYYAAVGHCLQVMRLAREQTLLHARAVKDMKRQNVA